MATSVAAAVPVATPVATPMATPVAVPVANQPTTKKGFSTAPSTGPNSWSGGMCGCFSCSWPDCGAMCLVNECCCGPCTYASAIAHTGVDPFNMDLHESTMCLVVLAGICCEVVPCQSLGVRTVARLEVAKKYEIKEDFMHSLCMELCCGCCSIWQVQNEIILKEGLKFGCTKLVKDDNPKQVAPAQTEMQR